MNVVFLAYREWALDVFPSVGRHPAVNQCVLCESEDDLARLKLADFDLLISCGWSNELGKQITEEILCIGVHCAELDRYSYGTPLQNQIIDGIKLTKHRVFKFTHGAKSPRAHTHTREFSHEVDLDLSGGMADVLKQMTVTSIVLFNMFLDDYPNVKWRRWPAESTRRAKRSPADSRLTKPQIAKMDTEQLYNFFRCLEAPYPNGYIEDEVGRLYIQKVVFKRK